MDALRAEKAPIGTGEPSPDAPSTETEAPRGLDDLWSWDELRLQTNRFRRFLSWLLVPFLVFVPYDVFLFLAYKDRSSGLLALLLLSLVPTLIYARRLLDKGRLERSVGVTVAALLVPATLIVFLRPFLYPVLVVGSLLAVAVALPFLRRSTLRRLVYAGIANAALIILVGTLSRPLDDGGVPAEARSATLGLALLAATSLVFLMIWLFSSRLTDSLAATRRSQADLAKTNEQLRRLDRAKTEFMNMTAHEFSTPLTPIMIQLHLLRNAEPAQLSPEQAHSLQMIERNFARLSQLAADLLDMPRVQSGKLRIQRVETALSTVIGQAVLANQGVADAAGIGLSAQLDDTLRVVVDPRRIAQVLDNLLGNALKFTPRGGQVHVELDRDGDEARVTVRDSGRGLSAQDLEKLFQAFSQVEAHSGGTGLGLFISEGIVKAHGGRMWAHSPGRGQGSTFGFVLPLLVRTRGDGIPEPLPLSVRA